jgi:hypothetical protein
VKVVRMQGASQFFCTPGILNGNLIKDGLFTEQSQKFFVGLFDR